AKHGSLDPRLGYSLILSSAILDLGKPVVIKLSGSIPLFRGLLMYVEGSDPRRHLGTFTHFDANHFKPQTAVCSKFKFAGDAASTLTHANAGAKYVSSTSFTWMPLLGDEKDPGPFVLRAVITAGSVGDSWQIVESAPLQFLGAQPNGPGPRPIDGLAS
ncbi:hypothetical protein HDU91_000127, partial [Kappamyces sp. JEL0680]